MIRSYLSVRRASGSVSAGKEKGSCSRTAHASRSAAPASPAGAEAGDPKRTPPLDNPGLSRALLAALALLAFYPARRPPRTLPASIALVACLPSLFATAVATPLTTTLLPTRAPRPWNRAQPPRCRSRAATRHRHSPPPCPTLLSSVARRWREEQDKSAPVSHVRD
ncbi:hypothetical protein B0H11DRAFT_2201071 [Mycena galericulata]|nr:hypothetical protein B0H11DRAFT_2201071 [Mycena galericulata]